MLLPEAIALSTLVVTGGGIGITAICKFAPRKDSAGSNGSGKLVLQSLCDERSANIEDSVARIEKNTGKIFDELKELRDRLR